MSEYLRPGVFIERVDASAPAVAAIRTDVAGFVGIAEAGPLHTPVPVQSFRQFQAHFGGFIGAGYLAYAVHAFFENGGHRCWVVRIASRDEDSGAACASVTIADGNGAAWRIRAANPGVWGDSLSVALVRLRSAQTTIASGTSIPRFATVTSVSGFTCGMLVRLHQADAVDQLRVLSHVDPVERRLYWIHPGPGAGLRYDLAVSGFDRNRPVSVESVSYRLLVYRAGRLVAQYHDLGIVPEGPAYGPSVLAPATYPPRLTGIDALPAAPPPIVVDALRTPGTAIPQPLQVVNYRRLPLSGGRDGLQALRPADFIGEPVSPLDSDHVKQRKRRGIGALNLVDEVAVVAVPDIVIQPERDPVYGPVERPRPDRCIKCPPPPPALAPPHQPESAGELPPVFSNAAIYQVQAALVQHCEERGDRFALLDPPWDAARDDAVGIGAVRAWRTRFDTSYAALHYPWLNVTEPRSLRPAGALVRPVPPSGHVAGLIANHDLSTGVHRAPANTPFAWVEAITAPVDPGEHEVLNPLGINAIVVTNARGIRVMGARTLSSDPDFRFINVRRLLMMIRKAMDISTQWAVFEPNDDATRTRIQLSLSGFLYALWQNGALAGATAEEAFFVKCDEENNRTEQRDAGWLLADVGVAPARPYEFIVIRVGRQGNELKIAETGVLARAA